MFYCLVEEQELSDNMLSAHASLLVISMHQLHGQAHFIDLLLGCIAWKFDISGNVSFCLLLSNFSKDFLQRNSGQDLKTLRGVRSMCRSRVE